VPLRRPYNARHTAATLWLASGENPEWFARQLGHTTTEMLFRIYSRFVPNLTRQDGNAFDRFVTGAMQPEPEVRDGTYLRDDVGNHFGIGSAQEQQAYKEQLKTELLGEFEDIPNADVLVISSEHMHSRLASEVIIERLKAYLEPWVVKLRPKLIHFH
jgi:hypothetical protein